MSDTTPMETALADLQASTVRALEVICRSLIDSRTLERETLIGDLVSAQVDLAGRGVGQWGSIPAALAAVLGAKSPGNS